MPACVVPLNRQFVQANRDEELEPKQCRTPERRARCESLLLEEMEIRLYRDRSPLGKAAEQFWEAVPLNMTSQDTDPLRRSLVPQIADVRRCQDLAVRRSPPNESERQIWLRSFEPPTLSALFCADGMDRAGMLALQFCRL
jgi:hypothetical protein